MDNPGLKQHKPPYLRVVSRNHYEALTNPIMPVPHTNNKDGYQTNIDDAALTKREDVETPPPLRGGTGEIGMVPATNGEQVSARPSEADTQDYYLGAAAPKAPPPAAPPTASPRPVAPAVAPANEETEAARARRISIQQGKGGGSKENPTYDAAQENVQLAMDRRNLLKSTGAARFEYGSCPVCDAEIDDLCTSTKPGPNYGKPISRPHPEREKKPVAKESSHPLFSEGERALRRAADVLWAEANAEATPYEELVDRVRLRRAAGFWDGEEEDDEPGMSQDDVDRRVGRDVIPTMEAQHWTTVHHTIDDSPTIWDESTQREYTGPGYHFEKTGPGGFKSNMVYDFHPINDNPQDQEPGWHIMTHAPLTSAPGHDVLPYRFESFARPANADYHHNQHMLELGEELHHQDEDEDEGRGAWDEPREEGSAVPAYLKRDMRRNEISGDPKHVFPEGINHGLFQRLNALAYHDTRDDLGRFAPKGTTQRETLKSKPGKFEQAKRQLGETEALAWDRLRREHPEVKIGPDESYDSHYKRLKAADRKKDPRKRQHNKIIHHVGQADDPREEIESLINGLPEAGSPVQYTEPDLDERNTLGEMGFGRAVYDNGQSYWLRRDPDREYMIGPGIDGNWETSSGPVGHLDEGLLPDTHTSFNEALEHLGVPPRAEPRRPGKLAPYEPGRPNPGIESLSRVQKQGNEDDDWWAAQPDVVNGITDSADQAGQSYVGPEEWDSGDLEDMGIPVNTSLGDHAHLLRAGYRWDGDERYPTYTREVWRNIVDSDGRPAHDQEGHVIQRQTHITQPNLEEGASPLSHPWTHSYYPAGLGGKGYTHGLNTAHQATRAGTQLSLWGTRHPDSIPLLDKYESIDDGTPFDHNMRLPHEL